MVQILFLMLAIIGCLWASFTDIRYRIIPNRLSLTLFSVGFVGNLVFSLYIGDYNILFRMVEGLVLIFIIGFLYWKVGGWGAADAKMFLFLGALVPLYPEFLTSHFNPVLGIYPFILTVFIDTMMAVFPFIIIYALVTSGRNMDFKALMPSSLDIRDFLISSTVITAALAMVALSGRWYVGLAYIFLTLFFPNWKNKLFLSVSIIFLTIMLGSNLGGGTELQSIVGYFALFFAVFFLLRFSFRLVNIIRISLRIQVPILELKEGDIIAERIYLEGEKVHRDERGMIELMREAVRTGDLEVIRKRREPIANTSAAGIDRDELERLKSLVKRNMLEDRILIRKGSPFAPVIFLGFLISLTMGDLFMILKGILYG